MFPAAQLHERRHTEEFAGHWISTLRGMWGVPSRNTDFVGREDEMASIATILQESGGGSGGSNGGSRGISLIETVGLGGVGKTQVCKRRTRREFEAVRTVLLSFFSSPKKTLLSLLQNLSS